MEFDIMNPDLNQLNLEHLKAQAKDLLKQWNDADATVQRKLAEAQHEVAQKYNYRNWAEMKHAIEAFLASPFDISNWVLTVMMRQTFGSLPSELEGQEFWSSLCRSDLSSVRRFIESGQFNVIDKGGPLNATPLVYACCSYAATSEVLGLAKYLIEKGADVNETYEDPNWPGSPLGALYGACGRQFNVELARLLLDSGAEINDEESVYHSTESADHSCLELLLSRGAKLKGTNGLLRALDFDRIEAVQLLLDAGADPNDSDFKENALHHAIRRGRSGEFGLLLAKYGVNLRGKSIDGFDVLTHAGLRGGSGMVEAMAKLGLSYPLDEIELFATYVSNGELERADQILATSPKIASKLTPQLVSIINDAAWAGDVERMKRLLQYGWPVSGISTTSNGFSR